MRSLIMFFSGLMLMALTCGMVVVGAAIFDTSKKQNVETYFFQPARLSEERIGVPASVNDLSESKILEMLTDKFITEYFYVIPNIKNAEMRINGDTGLFNMVSSVVFDDWVKNMGPEITKMAKAGMLRTARLTDMIKQKDSAEWWELKYEMLTWETPNKITQNPIVTQGSMYVRLRYEPGWKPKSINTTEEMDITTHLEEGGDPSYIFKFKIENIE